MQGGAIFMAVVVNGVDDAGCGQQAKQAGYQAVKDAGTGNWHEGWGDTCAAAHGLPAMAAVYAIK